MYIYTRSNTLFTRFEEKFRVLRLSLRVFLPFRIKSEEALRPDPNTIRIRLRISLI